MVYYVSYVTMSVVLMLDGSLFGVDGLLSSVVVCQQYYFDVPSVMYMKKVA